MSIYTENVKHDDEDNADHRDNGDCNNKRMMAG